MSTQRSTPRVNWRMLLKVTGWLLVIEGLMMAVPAIVSACYGEHDAEEMGIIALITAAVGVGMRSIHAEHTTMGRREGFLLTAWVWVWFSLFGMLPFIFCTQHFGVSDAFFEAMSGFTTTGGSMLDSHGDLSHGVNLWRAMTQWLGGMGIILFTLAVIPMLNSAGGMQMFNAEVTGITHDKIRPRISSTAKRLWGTYFALTAALIGLLWAGPMDLFDSACYAFSTISTGGFAPTADGLLEYNSSYVYIVMTIFMFLGGVNTALIFAAATGHPGKVWENQVFRVFIYVLAGVYICFIGSYIVNYHGPSTWQDYTVYPLFQIVSTITSTGYDTGHFGNHWSPFVIALTLGMMFSGACAGSTSGGAKLDRLIIGFKHLHNEVRRTVRPNAVYSVTSNGRVMRPELVDKVMAFLAIYVLLGVVGGTLLTILHVPVLDAFFSAFSCVSNTGFGTAVTGYGAGFQIIPDAGKWILSLLMLIGRLEIFTVLILFTRTFWRH